MSHWVLPQSGIPMSVTTVQRVTNWEKQTDEMKKRMDDFQQSVQSRWDARSSTIESPPTEIALLLKNEDEECAEEFDRVIKSKDLADLNSNDETEEFGPDNWLNVEVGMSMEEQGFCQGRVKKRAIDADGKPMGTANDNVLLDSCACKIKFSDGQTEIPTADNVAENLLAEADAKGKRFLLMEEIECHRKTADAIPEHKGTFLTSHGIKRKKRTTQGWEFLARWKGGTSDWVTLKELKESCPVQLADCVISNDLQGEPAFDWWLSCVNKKRKAVVSKVKSKYFQQTHKCRL